MSGSMPDAAVRQERQVRLWQVPNGRFKSKTALTPVVAMTALAFPVNNCCESEFVATLTDGVKG
jgi:hypothetical protein